jgi:hypothetical protein
MNNYDLFEYIINYYEWEMEIIYDFITWPLGVTKFRTFSSGLSQL